MLKRPMPGTAYGKRNPLWNDPLMRDDYPLLHAHLAQVEYDDKSMRQTSTITMYVDQGSLVLVLNDRDNNRSAFFSEESLVLIFDKVEAQLRTDEVEWKSKKEYQKPSEKTPF